MEEAADLNVIDGSGIAQQKKRMLGIGKRFYNGLEDKNILMKRNKTKGRKQLSWEEIRDRSRLKNKNNCGVYYTEEYAEEYTEEEENERRKKRATELKTNRQQAIREKEKEKKTANIELEKTPRFHWNSLRIDSVLYMHIEHF